MGNTQQMQVIIAKAKKGNTKALGEIVDEYQSPIRGFIAMLGVPSDLIIDLSQETFLTAFKKLNTFKSENSFGPWLRGIARNLVYQHYASEKKQTLLKKNAIEFLLLDNEVTKESIDKVDAYRKEYLSLCLNELPEKAAELIRQKYEESKNSVQIGKTLKLKPNTIRKNLARIQQKLKSCVESKLSMGKI